jgi:hypothetical protein
MTDLNKEALEKARQAVFQADSYVNVAETAIRAYLAAAPAPAGDVGEIAKQLEEGPRAGCAENPGWEEMAAEAAAMLRALGATLDHVSSNWRAEIQAREAAERERDELVKVLKFYRDGFRFHPKRSKTGFNISEWKPTEELLDDCGNLAKDALSRLVKKGGGQ